METAQFLILIATGHFNYAVFVIVALEQIRKPKLPLPVLAFIHTSEMCSGNWTVPRYLAVLLHFPLSFPTFHGSRLKYSSHPLLLTIQNNYHTFHLSPVLDTAALSNQRIDINRYRTELPLAQEMCVCVCVFVSCFCSGNLQW